MKQILLLIFFLSITLGVYADSPLTSTEFYVAYLNCDIVKEAERQHGVLNERLLDYIDNHPKDYAVNLAIINAIGWDINIASQHIEKSNYTLFETYLKRKYACKDISDLCKKCNANTLMCLAYNKALTYYFDVSEAIDIAKIALSKDNNSRILNIIYSLIYVQNAAWPLVAPIVRKACFDNSLRNDCSHQAIDIIWDYIKEYEKYEKNHTPSNQSNSSKTIWDSLHELSNQYTATIYEADSLKHLAFRQRYNASESNRLQGEYQRRQQQADGLRKEYDNAFAYAEKLCSDMVDKGENLYAAYYGLGWLYNNKAAVVGCEVGLISHQDDNLEDKNRELYDYLVKSLHYSEKAYDLDNNNEAYQLMIFNRQQLHLDEYMPTFKISTSDVVKRYPDFDEIEDNNIVIKKVVIQDNQTIVEFSNTNKTKKGYFQWMTIDRNTYMQIGSKKYYLVKSEGIGINPDKTYYYSAGEQKDFALYFPAIPKNTISIDIVEPGNSDWKFYNIKLK